MSEATKQDQQQPETVNAEAWAHLLRFDHAQVCGTPSGHTVPDQCMPAEPKSEESQQQQTQA